MHAPTHFLSMPIQHLQPPAFLSIPLDEMLHPNCLANAFAILTSFLATIKSTRPTAEMANALTDRLIAEVLTPDAMKRVDEVTGETNSPRTLALYLQLAFIATLADVEHDPGTDPERVDENEGKAPWLQAPRVRWV